MAGCTEALPAIFSIAVTTGGGSTRRLEVICRHLPRQARDLLHAQAVVRQFGPEGGGKSLTRSGWGSDDGGSHRQRVDLAGKFQQALECSERQESIQR